MTAFDLPLLRETSPCAFATTSTTTALLLLLPLPLLSLRPCTRPPRHRLGILFRLEAMEYACEAHGHLRPTLAPHPYPPGTLRYIFYLYYA